MSSLIYVSYLVGKNGHQELAGSKDVDDPVDKVVVLLLRTEITHQIENNR